MRKKCVHEKSRCDLHPHKDCIYNNTQGQIIAEDEEDCLEDYKKKSLIPQTANFPCISPIHNSNSSAILSTVYDRTTYETKYNVIVIGSGTMVRMWGTRCDGNIDCWKSIDEADCGWSTFQTVFVGM